MRCPEKWFQKKHWKNILDPFRRFLFTHLHFWAFSVDECYATVKTISSKRLTAATALTYIKNDVSFKKYSTRNSYQSESLLIQDNVYNDYRTVFSSMDENMKKWPQTETVSQTGAFTLMWKTFFKNVLCKLTYISALFRLPIRISTSIQYPIRSKISLVKHQHSWNTSRTWYMEI